MRISDFTIHSQDRLDVLLADCVENLFDKQRNQDSEYWGLVSAAIMDPEDNVVFGVNHLTDDGTRKHAERVAIENYEQKYGEIPEGCIVITTLSPCSKEMDRRWGESCTEMLNNLGIKKVYAGWSDPSQDDSDEYLHKQFHTQETKNPKLRELCKKIGLLAIK